MIEADEIFVFGSNLAGRHGKGAARDALVKYGARYGVGEGVQGRSYAIPTKGLQLEVRSLDAIQVSVVAFIEFAIAHPEMKFYVTRIGCGYAGYQDAEIAPLFARAPANCRLPQGWRDLIKPPSQKEAPTGAEDPLQLASAPPARVTPCRLHDSSEESE